MAGFSKVYFIGSTGGFMGADGLARPFVQIMQGDADRQWFEAIYQDDAMSALGSIKALVPAGPDHPLAILDAAIAFLPQLFQECPSLETVKKKLQGVIQLDFDLGNSVPLEWQRLREEALPIFQALNVFEADLRPMDLKKLRVSPDLAWRSGESSP